MGVLVWGLMFWCAGRYTRKNEALPRQTKYNLPLEIGYTILPLVIVSGLFYFTVRTENYVDARSKNPSVDIQVNAFKWNWQFEYHQYQGQETRYAVADQAGQPTYVSTVGSSGEIPVLVVPRGQTVRIHEHSLDVIHSFWVPEFLFKRDVLPYGPEDKKNQAVPTGSTNSDARDNQFEFTATVDGSYVGRCAELCGTYHSQMNFEVRVVEPASFQAYVTRLSQLGPANPARQSIALSSIGGAPCATTTHPFTTDRTARAESEPPGGCV